MPGATHAREVDVVVVGAGLAGLTAATRLAAAGRSVVVLEARSRVGGRTYDLPVGDDGAVAELGGQWIGPGQDRVLALAAELGVETFESYAEGDGLLLRDGGLERYAGAIPPVGERALTELGAVLAELDALARDVDPARPWEAADAAALDAQSVGAWAFERLHDPAARMLLHLELQAVYAVEPTEVSLLDVLASTAGIGGEVNTMLDTAQSWRLKGGPQQLSRALAARLGDDLVLECPVDGVAWGEGGVVVRSAGRTWSARRAVVAIPGALVSRLAFDPPLPALHDLHFQRQPEGLAIKVNAVYERPFWRERGLSGQALSDTGPVRYCADNSPPGGSPGVLVAFFVGADAARVVGATAGERRRLVLDRLAEWHGPEAARPVAVHELVWAAEPYSRGAYCTYCAPGVLTTVGRARAEPLAGLHFAGADGATRWSGYMEGAIRSGEDAAEAALAAL